MRNFYYALKQVFKFRWSNVIKLLSLTLGITIGGALFVRVAFERSFDNFLPDVERLYRVEALYTIGEEVRSGETIMAPVAPKIKEQMPQVEQATRFFDVGQVKFTPDEEHFFTLGTLVADSAFFDVLDFTVLRGEPHKDLTVAGNVYISDEAAHKIFGDKDPIGQQLTRDGQSPVTVAGVFRKVPRNSHLDFDALYYMDDMFPDRWDGGDSFYSYVKVQPGTDPVQLEQQINTMLAPYHTDFSEKQKLNIKYLLNPVRRIFADRVVDIDIIMSLLALVLILVSSLNYVLLTLSSLASRAKEVGVHKASGARAGGIFAIILWETAVYVLLALGLSVLLMAGLREQLEPIMESYDYLFVWGNLWALVVVVGVLFLIAGVIPACIFAKISVAQIFRRYTDSKMWWKRALLFFQFFASAFILSFLFIIVRQYDTMINYNVGYNHDNVAYVDLATAELRQAELISENVGQMAVVSKVALANSLPLRGDASGMGVAPEGQERLFRAGEVQVDSRYFDIFDIPVLQGRNLYPTGDSSSVVVNREFVRRLPAGTEPLGFTYFGNGQMRQVVGIVPDIQLSSLRSTKEPAAYVPFSWTTAPVMVIKFKELTSDNIKIVEKRLKELDPKQDYHLSVYVNSLRWQYADEQNFRDGVIIASLILLLITVMGIVGYTATEIRRRSREMAVRKINGARTVDVLGLMIRSSLWICLVAVVGGALCAYVMGGYWQNEFTVKTPLSWWIFVGAGCAVLLMVVVTIGMQSYRIASANPSRFLKSE